MSKKLTDFFKKLGQLFQLAMILKNFHLPYTFSFPRTKYYGF